MAVNAAAHAVIDVEAGQGAMLDGLRQDALAALTERILPEWLTHRRWYAAKDAGPPRVRVAEAVPFGQNGVRFLLTILLVEPPGLPPQRYFLPLTTVSDPDFDAAAASVLARLRRGDSEALLIDAFADDRFVRALLDGIRRGGDPEAGQGAGQGPSQEKGQAKGLRFRRSHAFADRDGALDRDPAIRVLATEQSNTSVAIGQTMILKGFRRLEAGVHPELEIGWYLTEVARFENTPALLGAVEWVDGGGQPTALGVLQEWVANQGDGWRFVLGKLEGRLQEAEDGASLAVPWLMPWLRRLGVRTAELHRAFALDTDDPAFTPEPVTATHLAQWTEAARIMAEAALDGLAPMVDRLDPYLKAEVEELLERREALMERIATLPPDSLRAVRTRLHGDFHLGQVLVAGDDAVILDFEGEPMRPLAERRAKHSPLRDVAGMLRSFAYAAAAAARSLPPDTPAARRTALIRALDGWAADATAAFLDGYRSAIGNTPSLPADPGHMVRLLRLFLLEKALYEITYERANRPDWLAIPVRGVLALLEAPSMMAHDSRGHAAVLPTVAPEAEVAETGPRARAGRGREMPQGHPALDRLASRMGIEPDYRNAAGETVRIADEVKRALLAAMGQAAADDAEAQARLDALDREELSRPLPPVMVLTEGRMPLLGPITLPQGTQTLRWRLILEDDREWRGEVSFPDLLLVREARLEGMVEQRELILDQRIPLGYHRLVLDFARDGGHDAEADASVIVTPRRCHVPEGLTDRRRIWGIATHLYLLRSRRNWGIGDYTDLKRLVETAAGLGVQVVGLNPLHALFHDQPEQASPYSPASRLYLNILNIDVTALPEFTVFAPRGGMIDDPVFQARLKEAREAPLVDYAAVAGLILPVLEALYETFKERGEPSRHQAFADFRRTQGEALARLCLFQVLREKFGGDDPAMADWRRWPPAYRVPYSDVVRRFAVEQQERIDFLAWTQWIADIQLSEAAAAARRSGMVIGLYRDLAVGADATGVETWSKPEVAVAGAHAGAPPDLFNPAGQDWGLPPFSPHALRHEGYRSFIQLVRANMRHAGGLRIDHAMALQHLYWVPEGRPPTEGAYVSYPMDDLVGILALESVRHRCVVVGEDLGTVPEGFRERMTAAGILSYRVLFFEQREDGGFIEPEAWPPLAVATVGSHDMATLRGWWEGRDIDLKERHGLYPDPGEAKRQRDRRARDKQALVEALRRCAHALPEDPPAGVAADAPFDPALSKAVHAFLAAARAGIAMVQIDDLADEAEQVNLPATIDEYPNWRRKFSIEIEDLADDPHVRSVARIMNEARPARPHRSHGPSSPFSPET